MKLYDISLSGDTCSNCYFILFLACPANTKRFGNMCYRYQQRPTSWLYANEQCNLLGGQLATIDGSSLNDFLYKNYRKPIYTNVWIGFKKCGTKWCHPDGKRSMYYKWNTGEPNNVGRNENCVEMWGNGYWNDAPCRNFKPSICEIPGIILSYFIPTET